MPVAHRSAGQRPDRRRHEAGGTPGVSGRQAAQGIDETQDVFRIHGIEPPNEPEDVAGACLALLGTTEHQCWQAFGSAANPVYEIVPCSAAPTSIGGPGGPFAAGEDGGALTRQGEAIEAAALAGALVLTLSTGRRRSV